MAVAILRAHCARIRVARRERELRYERATPRRGAGALRLRSSPHPKLCDEARGKGASLQGRAFPSGLLPNESLCIRLPLRTRAAEESWEAVSPASSYPNPAGLSLIYCERLRSRLRSRASRGAGRALL